MKTLTSIIAAFSLVLASRSASAQVQTRDLYSFSGVDGDGPAAPLVEAADGTFYGTTWGGGDAGLGTVFRMTPNGTLTVLHSFAGAEDGSHPGGGALIQAADGNFYGITAEGGAGGFGAFFRMTPAGVIDTVHPFAGGNADGARPQSNLVLSADGEFFGTTAGGGPSGKGIVYRMAPDGAFAIVYAFTGGADGSSPGGLLPLADGSFLLSASGGTLGFGAIVKLTLDGTLTVVHSFTGGVEGSYGGGLAQGLDGNFYGTSINGGTSRLGSVFRMTPSGAVTTIHSFVGSPQGAYPGGLIRGTDGRFYGTTMAGGRWFTFSSTGTVFRIQADGTFNVLHVFDGNFDGNDPQAHLIQASDGNLYGSTRSGGFGSSGVVFRVDTMLCSDTLLASYTPTSPTDGVLYVGSTLHSWVPSTWSMWALYPGHITRLWALPIPAVSLPAVPVRFSWPDVPKMGPIGLLTTLSTPEQSVMCLDWGIVDTGS